MNLQANFPTGVTNITVHGLHEWDYGRKLDITSASMEGLGMIEVHFAHAGMKEAIVHLGSVGGQTLTVAIPDECLKQSAPIIAWVFVPTDDEGRTILTVTLMVEARTRPAGEDSVPPESYSDKYTELISAATALIEHTYTRAELAIVLGTYIDDLDALIGGGA